MGFTLHNFLNSLPEIFENFLKPFMLQIFKKRAGSGINIASAFLHQDPDSVSSQNSVRFMQIRLFTIPPIALFLYSIFFAVF